MVSDSTSKENRVACYRVLQAHADKVAERQYALQLDAHLKKGRKKSTFKWKPTPVLRKLVEMSEQVVGWKTRAPSITPKEVMSYLAHDYDFNRERYG